MPHQPARLRWQGHPPGLFVLAIAEACERLGANLLTALFVLYLNERFGVSKERSAAWYGTYMTCMYLTPLAGGIVGSRLVGRRTWVAAGATLLGLGYLLFGSGTVPGLMTGFCVLAVGNGLFKPNISALVGDLYPPGDARRDEAFAMFYMSVNIGVLLGPLIGELLRAKYGWRAAFLSASAALALAVVAMLLGRALLRAVPQVLAGSSAAPRTENAQWPPMTARDRRKLLILGGMGLAMVPFWMAYYQTNGILSFVIRDQVDRGLPFAIFNLREIPTGTFTSLGGFFVLVLTLPLAAALRRLSRIGWLRRSEDKLPLGLSMACGAFLLLALMVPRGAGTMSVLWIVLFYLLLIIAELLLSPVGLSLFSKHTPPRYAGLLMGYWYFTMSMGSQLAGQVGRLATPLGQPMFFGLMSLLLALLAAVSILFAHVRRRDRSAPDSALSLPPSNQT